MKPQLHSTQDRPVLDESTFQQLLAAAYTLQEHNDRLRGKESPVDHTQTLSEIVETQKLVQTRQLDLQAAAALIAERAQKITKASGAAIGVVEEQDRLWYLAGTGSAAVQAGSRLLFDSCLSVSCLREGRILQCPNAGKDRRLPFELCRERGVQALIAVPVYHEGRISGVVELHFANANSFQEHDVRTCQLMAGLVTEAIARSAEMEWRQALAAQQLAMFEALDRIKPQLERLAVDPVTPPVEKAPEPVIPAVAPAVMLPSELAGHHPALPSEIPAAREEVAEAPPPVTSPAIAPVEIALTAVPVASKPAADSAAPAKAPDPASAIPPASTNTVVESAAPRPVAVARRPGKKPESEAICRGCGHHFVEKEYFCGICGTARMERGPDGEMQSTWSSLWHLQQAAQKKGKGKGISLAAIEAGKTTARKELDEEIHNPPTRLEDVKLADSHSLQDRIEKSETAEPEADPETPDDGLYPPDAPLPLELQQIIERFSAEERESLAQMSAELKPPVEAEAVPAPDLSLRMVPAEVEGPPANLPSSASLQVYPWTSAANARAWLESLKAQRPSRAWWAQLWHRQRANIYLGAATVILLIVLSLVFSGWGSQPQDSGSAASANPAMSARRRRNPPPPNLTLFEKILVSLGLAEAPPAPVYLGNPNTQVWVDLHTALYYCPGSDLYGKTVGGKYTSQHDAQQDQFEPAYRRACD